jgi:MurNAc alpha-1-phosphate uridylyltransferase
MLNKNISAMILAAGYGKRLLPITKKIPKPLVKINNKTLLQNTLDHLINLKCKEIIINTHYKHKKIENFIKNNYSNSSIKLSYEKKILDTGGAIKKALPLFNNNNVLILNSDIFWSSKNFIDIKKLIINFKKEQICRLLLVSKDNAHGIYRNKGDFVIDNNLIKRFKEFNKIYFYSGAQIISLDILNGYNKKIFSFNKIWDDLISKKLVFGELMSSDWYHIGDINGLKEAEKLT